MSEILENLNGKIRSRPVHPRLRRILIAAAKLSGVDRVVVTSGGQMSLKDAKAKGAKKVKGSSKWRLPNGQIARTGSTRHDDGLAADLKLEVGGKRLGFNTKAGQKVFESFAQNSVALGCTGLGAGKGYMGYQTMHVGFGNPAVWNGKGQPVLDWLEQAVERGKTQPIDIETVLPKPSRSADPGVFKVTARSGLKLRGGPGTHFEQFGTLEFGTLVHVVRYAGSLNDWALVDVEGDGIRDGFMFAEFLDEVDDFETDDDGCTDCD